MGFFPNRGWYRNGFPTGLRNTVGILAAIAVILWGILAVLAQVGPGEAQANLEKWTGISGWPGWLFGPPALWVCLVLAVAGAVTGSRLKKRSGALLAFAHDREVDSGLRQHHGTRATVRDETDGIQASIAALHNDVRALFTIPPSQTAPPSQPVAKSPEERTRYRALWLALQSWAKQANTLLRSDEWPTWVTKEDEQGWMNSAIQWEQTMTHQLRAQHRVHFPEHGARLSPLIAPLWKSGTAAKRGDHSELFCAAYQRLSMQRVVLLELVEVVAQEMVD
jgi:hypothetical protein